MKWGLRDETYLLVISILIKWGRAPLEAGSPRIPEAKITNPSKKKSQWNPGGFLNGNSDP
jgi:hypothetical protein